MFFKKVLIAMLLLIGLISKAAPQGEVVVSTIKQIRFQFWLDDKGAPTYTLSFKDKAVINPSGLGFRLNHSVLDRDFKITKVDSTFIDENWQPVLGEQRSIRNNYKQVTIKLQQKTAPNLQLNLVFKLFEDGLGFRYEFPQQANLTYFVINEEKTVFNLAGNHQAFWIPGDYNSNEYIYSNTKLSEVDAWKVAAISSGNNLENRPNQNTVQTPLLLKSNDGLYINIHEAAQVNFPAMQLHVNRSSFALSADLVPDGKANKAYLRTPFYTPWRTIIVSDKATDLLASKMILNLNDPSKIENTDWIKPMKFMGVWWEMQINKSSWNYTDNLDDLGIDGKPKPNGRHGANTANVKRYIDFASKHGIEGLLVEGWNWGWEEWNENKPEKFDFTTPYPDFDLHEVNSYAKQKGVKMIMHHETGGATTSYERQMDTAFRLMNNFGYSSVKTGYVGNMLPRGEHHDGQWMSNHYLHSITKAAQYKIMVDIHEPMRPTGLHRTWPNFLACEAGRGNEWNAFSEGSPPDHETILPFTRLMGGPMDYTPGIFKLRNYSKDVPNRQMHSTLAKQLALYITMYSPLQMAADLPENYAAHLDAFAFIKEVALDWDETYYLEAEPGDFITVARKEKGKQNWFIGCITDENSRIASVDLTFLDKGKKYEATIYADGDKADWKTNPEAYKIEKIVVDAKTVLKLKLANGGGAAVSIKSI